MWKKIVMKICLYVEEEKWGNRIDVIKVIIEIDIIDVLI